MQKRSSGFTLIELLIVIVIIGILAAIAIPKFGKTREKAYVKAMQSDLRNLAAQQEIYYSQGDYTYADAATDAELLANLDIAASQGVSIVVDGTNTGWAATAGHAALSALTICSIYSGSHAAVGPATTPGVIACDE
ncbi:MAG: prepilin-type N-terminal cleavage/methylation domain-containing protein [Gemmatimonadota bacterium]